MHGFPIKQPSEVYGEMQRLSWDDLLLNSDAPGDPRGPTQIFLSWFNLHFDVLQQKIII